MTILQTSLRIGRELATFGIALLAMSCHASPQSLSFSQFFQRPVGPLGLQPTAVLMSLRGYAVELQGFALRPLESSQTTWILSPVAITLSGEDESLADDLPASVAYLHGLDPAMQQILHGCLRQVLVTGILDVGRMRESDGRLSYVRLKALEVHCSKGPSS